MLAVRQRAIALAVTLVLAFSLGIYWGREHLYTSVLRLTAPDSSTLSQGGTVHRQQQPESLTTSSPGKRANAALFMLARNEDLGGVLESVQQVEMHFNRRYHYPFVFLNDKEFTPHFIESISVRVPYQ